MKERYTASEVSEIDTAHREALMNARAANDKLRISLEQMTAERDKLLEAVGLASTALPRMEVDVDNPVDMMKQVVEEIERLRTRPLFESRKKAIHERDEAREDVERLKKRLGHANGALEDIKTLITSCIGKDADPELQETAAAVLNRILSSASRVWDKPGWYRHEWEEKEWERYLSGEMKACASESASKDVAASFEGLHRQATPEEVAAVLTDEQTARAELIGGYVEDLVGAFLWYDRKEDEDLPRGVIENDIADGVITVDQIVARFAAELRRHTEEGGR